MRPLEILTQNPLPSGYDFLPFLPMIEKYHPKEDVWANFKDDRGVKTYFKDYMRYAWTVGATTIVEIGVRHGFTGMAMCYGAYLQQRDEIDSCSQAQITYLGFDSEEWVPGSNTIAMLNFRLLPYVEKHFYRMDTFGTNNLSLAVNSSRPYPSICLAHVDGDHNYEHALHDMELLWPSVRPNGLMVVDDATIIPDVRRAVEVFSSRYHVTHDIQMNETGHALFLKE